jgi:Holliday junction DNA helicase RuvA
MINYLKGTLVSKVENSPSGCSMTIEVNDIGYLVLTNRRVLDSVKDSEEKVKIYTSLIHREDTMCLCGFATREDRDLFNILQSVSGIGIKVALLLLEEFSSQELVSVVVREDAKALSRTKGVGPKLASRIILELKDKMTGWREKTEYKHVEKISSEEKKQLLVYQEAESVLLSLGYSKEESETGLQKAITQSENTENIEELLRHALQYLSV